MQPKKKEDGNIIVKRNLWGRQQSEPSAFENVDVSHFLREVQGNKNTVVPSVLEMVEKKKRLRNWWLHVENKTWATSMFAMYECKTTMLFAILHKTKGENNLLTKKKKKKWKTRALKMELGI